MGNCLSRRYSVCLKLLFFGGRERCGNVINVHLAASDLSSES